MADDQEIDPQYCWILPECLEATDRTKRHGAEKHASKFANVDVIATCVNRLTSGDGIAGSYYPHIVAEIRAIHHKWKQWDHKSLCTYSEFLHINCSLEVIREIGLDVHGELSDFLSVDPSETVPPALSIKVINPQEARKYINIGVHLGTDIPRIPSTLEEAAAAFGKLSALITSTRSVVEIEAKIAETHDGYTIWTLEREKFRVETRERYREVLIDMAMEEKLSDLRKKKRQRL